MNRVDMQLRVALQTQILDYKTWQTGFCEVIYREVGYKGLAVPAF